MRRFVFIGALAAGLAQGSSQGLAQTDAFDVGAPEGAERTAHLVRAYDAYDLPTGAFERDAATIETLRGKVTWQAFRLDDLAAFGTRHRQPDTGWRACRCSAMKASNSASERPRAVGAASDGATTSAVL